MAGNSNELAIIQERATIDALKNIDTQVKANIQTFITLKDQMDTVNNMFRTGLPRDFTNGAAQLADVLQKLAKIEQDFITLQNRLNQVQQRNNQTTSQSALETARLREEKRLLNKEYKDQSVVAIQEQQRLNASLGLYNKVQLKLNALTVKYNELAIKKQLGVKLSEREEKSLVALQNKIKKYDDALKAVDASVGKHQRNVGNYASGFNALGNSVNQLTRELPAFANSFQTGFMAISNNIPIFVDAIKSIIDKNKELREQGQPTVSTFKQIASSILSWGTALSLGVTLLTFFGDDLAKWALSLISVKEKTDELSESQKAFDAVVEGGSFKKVVSDVKEMAENIELARKGFIDKDRVLKEYNDSLGTVLGTAKSFNEMEDLMVKKTPAYLEAMKLRMAGQQLLNQSAEATAKITLMNYQSDQQFYGSMDKIKQWVKDLKITDPKDRVKMEASLRKSAMETRKEQQKELNETVKSTNKAYDDIMKKAAEVSKKGGLNTSNLFLGDDKDKDKKKKDDVSKQQRDYLNDLEAFRDRLLAINERNYIEGNLKEEEYVEKQFQINKAYYEAKLKYIKGKTATERKMIAETQLEMVKSEKERNKKLYDIQKKRLDNSRSLMEAEIDNELKLIQKDRRIMEVERLNQQISTYGKLIERTSLYYATLIKLAGNNKEEILRLEKERDEKTTDLRTKQIDIASQNPEASEKDLAYYREIENLAKSASDINKQTEIISKSKLSTEEKAYALQMLQFQQIKEVNDLEIDRLENDILRLEAKGLFDVLDQKELARLKEQLALRKKSNEENANAEKQAKIDEFKRKMQPASDFIKGSLNDLGFSNLADQYDKTLQQILDDTFEWKDAMILAANAVADALTMVSERQKERTIANLDEQLKLSQENTELELGFITSRLDALNNIQDKTAEQIQERNALEDEARTVREQQQQRERLIAEQKAKAEQRAAAQQALINGALAATMTLAQLGFIAGAIPAGLALAFGIAQSIAIMSRNPVPQYYTGTDNALGGYAYTQERGAEIHTDKLGNIKSLGNKRGKQLTYTEKGDVIYNASETKDILSKFDSMPKVGTNLLSGSLLTNLSVPMVVNNSIDSHEIADLIGKKFESALRKNNKSINIYEENGTIFKQVGSKIPEAIGKSSNKTIVVKSKRSYKDFRD